MKLTRRTLLRWLGITGAASVLSGLSLPEPVPAPVPVTVDDLPRLTADYPILLSDDDPGNLRLYELLFARFGLTCIATTNPRYTLELCRKVPVSLIISDVMKPDIDGYDMLRRLKSDPATQHIPLMFISARCRAEDRLRGFELGAVDYLGKPILREDIEGHVRRALIDHGNWRMPVDFDPVLFEQLRTSDPRLSEILNKTRVTAARGKDNAT